MVFSSSLSSPLPSMPPYPEAQAGKSQDSKRGSRSLHHPWRYRRLGSAHTRKNPRLNQWTSRLPYSGQWPQALSCLQPTSGLVSFQTSLMESPQGSGMVPCCYLPNIAQMAPLRVGPARSNLHPQEFHISRRRDCYHDKSLYWTRAPPAST